jgi:ectoine hydroxylase-related dioxygenase (phytanoyl-CoA dioxygenase family)
MRLINIELEAIRDTYSRDGVVVVRDFFSEETIIDALIESQRLSSLAHCDSFDESIFWKKQGEIFFLEKFEPVIDRSSIFLNISRDQDLLRLVGLVLDDDSPLLLKDKLIYKSPGQNGYPLHQDYNWWHQYPADEICTVVVPLEKSNLSNGGIEFYAGCHKEIYLPHGENRGLENHEIRDLGNKDSVIYDLNPGDVLVFHSLIPHFSGRNMSCCGRTQFYPTYCSSRVGDVYESQLVNHRKMVRRNNQKNIY